jgi:parallel beta-helix repeat protein
MELGPTIPSNEWVNISPAYVGQPNGGALAPMTYNVIGAYDPASKRTMSFDRWTDTVRGVSIYANAVVAYDPGTNTVTVLKLNNWTQTTDSTGVTVMQPLAANAADPTPIDRHPLGGLALVPGTGALYLVNGANQSARNYYTDHPDDTWKFNLSSKTWTLAVPSSGVHPPTDVSSYSGMVYDAATGKCAYFEVQYPNGTRTWLLDPNTNQWSQVAADASAANVYISGAGIAYDTKRNLAVAFGGGYYSTSAASTKLWAYSVASNKWTALADAPIAATGAEFAYDSTHDVFLAVVGQSTLIYNPNTNSWSQLTTTLNRGTNLSRQNVTYNVAYDVFVFEGGTWDNPVWSLLRYDPAASSTVAALGSPTGLTAQPVSSSQINLQWTASPSAGIAGYVVYRNGIRIGTTGATAFADTGLSPSMTYSYSVAAYDTSGAMSAQSGMATAITLAATPPTSVTQPPTTAPASLHLGRGCTTAWFIDEDCDGYGVAVRSSGSYGGPGVGDRPDADDRDPAINTAQTVLAQYDANHNGVLDPSELKLFLSQHKGISSAKDVYYMAPTGNNATGLKNDPSHPFADYYNGVRTRLQPGDVVVYAAGTYDEPYIESVTSGLQGSPIVIMASPGARVLFNPKAEAMGLEGSHDVIVDGFIIDNPYNSGLGTGLGVGQSTRTTVRNIEVERFNYLSSIDDMHDVVIEHWVSHHQSEHGLYLGARDNPSTNVTVRDSLFYKNGVESGYGAIQYNGRVTNLRIERNIIHSNGQWGLSLKEGVSNSVFQDNVIFNNQGHGIVFDIYPGDCVNSTGICPYSQTGNLITNNTIWIGKYDLTGIVPVGNIPTNAAAILVARNMGTVGDGHDQGQNTFQNNILVTYNGPAFRYTSPEWLDTTTVQNNLIYRVAGDGDVADFSTTSYSFTSFDATYALVHDNRFGNPMLASTSIDFWSNPSAFNFNLLTGSPAIGIGVATGAPSYDLRGTTRTMPPDAGAYVAGGGQADSLTPPTNVRIIK